MIHGLHGRTPGILLALAAIALAIAAGAAATPTSATAPLPAPPPSICRATPDPAWSTVPDSGPVADYSGYQDYREALGLTGLTAAGVRLGDIEYEWHASHVDLATRGLPASPQTPLRPEYLAAEHGTAVLAALGAAADGQGVTGLVTGAQLLPRSPYVPTAAAPSRLTYQPWVGIAEATKGLRAGDVLLIELQAFATWTDPGAPADAKPTTTFGPVEADARVRDAIRAAVAKGIVVVEPAGNGDVDLAGFRDAPWVGATGTADDSGALLVGAGGAAVAPGTAELRRAPGSNFGARVDVQGIGAGVVTAGYGDGLGGTGDRAYTSCFDGTSSASATVAGAVAALQAGAIARTGAPLTPAQVRALLRDTGSPQVDPEEGAIGPRPRIDVALARLQGAPPPGDVAPPGPDPAEAADGGALLPSPPAVTRVQALIPVATRATATYARTAHRLVIRLRGLPAGTRVTLAGRRLVAAGGRVVLKGVRAGRLVLVVTPPPRLRSTVRSVQVIVTVPRAGAARATLR